MSFLFNWSSSNSNNNNNNNNAAAATPAAAQQQDPCCICLSATDPAGGQFIISPGCCGKVFHMKCLSEYQAAGGSNCPHCRKSFPASANLASPPAQPLPVHPAPAPVPARARFQIFGRPSLSSTTSELLAEEDVNPPLKSEGGKKDEISKGSSVPLENLLSLSLVPEYPVDGITANSNFHVRVSVVYNEVDSVIEQRNPMDIVCILDNSGSMQGEKIENLKKAVEFVISTMNENDRLSLVTFNSSACVEMGLKKLNTANKEVARNTLRRITAGGGTDIFDGMSKGWDILQQRRTKNPATCVFLLTDGQDRGKLEEKKRLARNIREAGAPLFVFGFGVDHDSEHMTTIANAAEGTFIYIETNDTVIDAFGGAIGSQQGYAMRMITVNMQTLLPGVSIQEVQAGSYRSTINADGRTADVTLSDLYSGERRDFLVRLQLPALANNDLDYAVLQAAAHYRLKVGGGDDAAFDLPPTPLSIQRVTEVPTTRERDINVDVEIFRFRIAAAISSALQLADRNDFANASAVLAAAKKVLQTESVSLRGNHKVTLSLLEDIDISLQRVASRSEYTTGGRAMMSEVFDGHSKQRMVYKKANKAAVYQTTSSSAQQTRAFASKGGF